MVTRLISATGDEIKEMSPMDLKESIFKSEGRVVMGQHLLFAGPGLVRGVTNSELMFAFGADMVMLNTFDLDDLDNNPGLCGLSFQELKEKCRRPIGIYLGCPKAGSEDGGKKALYRREGMLASDEHVKKCIELGADFIVLGGNPGSGTSIKDVVETAKRIKQKYKDQIFVFAGKWEDGINEKVLGDPLANYDAKEIIKELIDALGGKKKSILSFAGFGDILMTCTSKNSRNFSFGYLIGSGATNEEVNKYLETTTVEGMYTLKSIHKLVRRKKVKMPIINLIHDIIEGKKDKEEMLKFLINK